jgi:hypothetical protein
VGNKSKASMGFAIHVERMLYNARSVGTSIMKNQMLSCVMNVDLADS